MRVEPRENVVDDRVRRFSEEDGSGKAVSEVRAHGSDGEANRGGHKGLVGRFIFQLGFGFNGWGSSPSGCTTSSCNTQDEIIEVAATHDGHSWPFRAVLSRQNSINFTILRSALPPRGSTNGVFKMVL